MPVSTDDYVSVSDFLGRYCWLVDEGDADGWAALWTEDGHFEGATPVPLTGREALKAVPRGVQVDNGRRLRHMIGSLHCDYVDGDADTIIAKYYNLVTVWPGGGHLACMAVCKVTMHRHGNSWQISRNDVFSLT